MFIQILRTSMKSSPIGVESVDKCHSCIIIVLDIHLSQIIIIEVSFIQLTTFCLIFHVYGWARKHYLKFLFPWLLLIEANQACLSGQTINHVLKKEGKKKRFQWFSSIRHVFLKVLSRFTKYAINIYVTWNWITFQNRIGCENVKSIVFW